MEKRQKKTCIKTEGKNGWTASIKNALLPNKNRIGSFEGLYVAESSLGQLQLNLKVNITAI